ncbi:TMEM175 family protein [Frigoriflavimonas asaccharolytica]|uniref:Putative membrane protein n=1 Tax=Frigoriflavimonas asaccharolytica TaxID=2735899 RepID=A0A8J8K7X3_9FLAO|nr:TMEM175 family protein [Frigoriflavimonas asaccharolytica]NRS91966.1 putative membrane protein [Frigoriflavimonas asaccharolytica]
MKTNRLEAFSDGVLAIIITIMVLEFKVPEEGTFEALKPLIPKIIAYVISFIYVGIYWNNHHHIFQIIEKVNGKILWANLTLLFFLSLIPFTSAWMGENHFEKNPVAVYGFVLFGCAVSFNILQNVAINSEGPDSLIANALRQKTKEYFSTAAYLVGIIISFFSPFVSLLLYFIVALLWLIPDRRVEKTLD